MKTQEELRAEHGTPDEFAAVVNQAADDLFCTTEEANAAIAKYRVEYAVAPSGGSTLNRRTGDECDQCLRQIPFAATHVGDTHFCSQKCAER